MNTQVLEEIVRLERAGVRCAVATVVETTGSVPGKLGARMIVFADGSQFGTVGGAGLEETVKLLALDALTGQSKAGLSSFDLARQKPGGLDSICGGSVSIYVEIMKPRPHLILFGGGHVGQAVAGLCDFLDYRYTVCDDRPEFTSAELFPNAVDRVVGPAAAFFDGSRELAPYSHLYVLGYSHHLDEDTLALAIKRFPGAIGLIGSRTKRNDLRSRLETRGIDNDTFDARVRCPIGMPIGAETPNEIAVSVLGDVISDYREAAAAAPANVPES